MSGVGERGNAQSRVGAAVAAALAVSETVQAEGVYTAECWGPREEDRQAYVELRDMIIARERMLDAERRAPRSLWRRVLDWFTGARDEVLHSFDIELAYLREQLRAFPLERKWADQFHNTVVTVGKNHLLDNYLAGSAYTAAFFVGLISSVSYSAIAAGDTMASHSGWTEAGPTNAPNYSQGTRPALAFSAASGGSKSTSSASAFSITGAGTVKGAFATTNSTKDGTTGTLLSAGLFSGGDRAVSNGDTLNVSYSLAV